MPPAKPLHAVLAARLVEAPAPTRSDPLGRPIVGPCLLWQGKPGQGGYARIKNAEAFGDRAPRLVHRVMYALDQGVDLKGGLAAIPHLDHLCRVHACSAPAHLEATGQDENTRRGILGRTECRNGHPYRPGSFSIESGSRRCLDCKRERYAASVGGAIQPGVGRPRYTTGPDPIEVVRPPR